MSRKASRFCSTSRNTSTDSINCGDCSRANPVGSSVAAVGPMVGTNVSSPHTRALNRARGDFSSNRPPQVSRKTVVAERVMPLSQPPNACLHSLSRCSIRSRAGRGVMATTMRLWALGSKASRIASSTIKNS